MSTELSFALTLFLHVTLLRILINFFQQTSFTHYHSQYTLSITLLVPESYSGIRLLITYPPQLLNSYINSIQYHIWKKSEFILQVVFVLAGSVIFWVKGSFKKKCITLTVA